MMGVVHFNTPIDRIRVFITSHSQPTRHITWDTAMSKYFFRIITQLIKPRRSVSFIHSAWTYRHRHFLSWNFNLFLKCSDRCNFLSSSGRTKGGAYSGIYGWSLGWNVRWLIVIVAVLLRRPRSSVLGVLVFIFRASSFELILKASIICQYILLV